MPDVAYPFQVVLVTSRGSAEILGKETAKDNIITVAWHTPISMEPSLYGISIGKSRFSYGLIKDSKVFAVNFISPRLEKAASVCGSTTGETTDKFSAAGLTKVECERIDCPRIAEADAYLECEVVDEFEEGDHVFFVGQVLQEGGEAFNKRLMYIGGGRFS